VIVGRCTGGAHRCKVKQGGREDRADVWILASKVVRFGGRVQTEREQIFLVTMAALCYLIIAQGSDRRCGRPISLNLRGRSAGIVPVDGCLGHTTLRSIVSNAQYFDTGEVPPCGKPGGPDGTIPLLTRNGLG
jgi:hypothetical protein